MSGRLVTELKRDTDRFLDHRLIPILELTRALTSFLGAPLRKVQMRHSRSLSRYGRKSEPTRKDITTEVAIQ